MNSRFVIFAVIAVLLVPFVYGTSFVPDACAAPGAPGYYSSQNCTGESFSKEGKTCCWREQVPGKLLGDTYCQKCREACTTDGCFETCGPPTKQAPAVGRQQESLGEATTLPNFSQSEGPRWGGVLQTDNNLTFSQANMSSDDSSNNTLALEQSDLASDTVEKTTRNVDDGQQEQDESGTTEEVASAEVDEAEEDKNDEEESPPQE